MAHAGKGSPPREQGRGWQTPTQLSRQKLSSASISAKCFLKVKIKCKEATELSSPSWWENPPLISASRFQALQTKPEFSFPSPCPNNPQCCSHTDTRICTGTRLAARPQENIPAGCCWSPQLFLRLLSREQMLPPAHRQGSARDKSPNSPRALPLLPGTACPAAASQLCPRRCCLYFPLPALQEAGSSRDGVQLRSPACWDL